MSFADIYFSRFKALPKIFQHDPCPDTGIIVVIPCLDDDFIFRTLESLEKAVQPKCKTEVIVIVNSGENTPQNAIENNRKIYIKLEQNAATYKSFHLLPHLIENTPKKIAGVGFARKTGMDEAVRRFNALNKPSGIIVSLDSDCLIEKDYFCEISNYFVKYSDSDACTVQFKHDFDEYLYSGDIISACTLYEIYLRYFRLSLQYCGYPNSLHTIGSCFCVTAQSYIKAGGMSKRQGGEDFYFLHKLALMTKIGTIDSKALVFPSPRISYRVPFGTGKAVSKIISENKYTVYNFKLFEILKQFYNNAENFYVQGKYVRSLIPEDIIECMDQELLKSHIDDCLKNTNNVNSFLRRFFAKFDAFFIVRFLNSFDQNSDFPPVDVCIAASQLLQKYNVNKTGGNVQKIYQEIFKLDFKLD